MEYLKKLVDKLIESW